jgi:hypothetical protein
MSKDWSKAREGIFMLVDLGNNHHVKAPNHSEYCELLERFDSGERSDFLYGKMCLGVFFGARAIERGNYYY